MPKTPILVGLIRGAGGAVLLAIIGVAIVQLGGVTSGAVLPFVPVAALALRALEAYVLDQRKATAAAVARKTRRARAARKRAAGKADK